MNMYEYGSSREERIKQLRQQRIEEDPFLRILDQLGLTEDEALALISNIPINKRTDKTLRDVLSGIKTDLNPEEIIKYKTRI